MKNNHERRIKLEEIGELRDVLVGSSLEANRRRWERIIDMKVPFAQFFIACPDEKINDIVSYLTERKGKSAQNTLKIEIDPRQHPGGIFDQLIELEKDIASTPGERVFIEVSGFEKLIKYWADRAPKSLWRVAHDFNQEIAENYRRPRPLSVPEGKKIIIITHISPSLGEETFKKSVQSALRSQFQDGAFVLA